ncbi:MAG: HdeD family acid-resistance protein [Nocardioidaceae bacterium]
MTNADAPDLSGRAAESPDPWQAGLGRLGANWGWVLTFGIALVILGVLALAMPGATLLALAVIFAVQLFVNGVFQIVAAFTSDEAGAGTRTLYGVLGALSILVGLLCLRAPLQTLLVLGLLLGSWWLVTGIIEIVNAISRADHTDRWVRLLMGVLSVAAGIVVLAQPGMSLAVLELVMAVWMVAYGVMAAVAAFALRSRTHHVAAPSPPTEGLAPA